jgi:5-hydroxyisourate hydrolase-like protein (transthyretin family)
MYASLTDADTVITPIAGALVEFFIDGVSVGTATTDANGNAQHGVPPKQRGDEHIYEVRFNGDDYYLGDSAEVSTIKKKK